MGLEEGEANRLDGGDEMKALGGGEGEALGQRRTAHDDDDEILPS